LREAVACELENRKFKLVSRPFLKTVILLRSEPDPRGDDFNVPGGEVRRVALVGGRFAVREGVGDVVTAAGRSG
jgi:hypothetical protein